VKGLGKILGGGVHGALAAAEVVEEVPVEAQVMAVTAALRDEQRATGRNCGKDACGRWANRCGREGVEGMGGPDDIERSDGVVELLHQGLVAGGADEWRSESELGLRERERRRVEQVVVDLQITGQPADIAELQERLGELPRAARDIEQRDPSASVGEAPKPCRVIDEPSSQTLIIPTRESVEGVHFGSAFLAPMSQAASGGVHGEQSRSSLSGGRSGCDGRLLD